MRLIAIRSHIYCLLWPSRSAYPARMSVDNLSNHTPRLPSLNGLRAFEAAGRHLSFRAAAQDLGVTQGAVAQQVRALEADLGLALFTRHARGLTLTAPGRAYHAQVASAFATLIAATQTLKPVARAVTLSVTASFAARWLIPNLDDFTRRHPEIDLRIVATDTVLSFHADGIDLAIRFGQPPFGASLDSQLLFVNDLIAVAAPSVADGGLTAQAIPRHVLLHDSLNLWPGFLRDALHIAQPPSGRNLRFSQITLALDAAIEGQGIALGAHFMVAPEIARGRLVQVHPQCLHDPRGYYLLSRRGAIGPAAATVRDWLIRAAAYPQSPASGGCTPASS
jgi:LysR family glycine cleavage system transcriptional activator